MGCSLNKWNCIFKVNALPRTRRVQCSAIIMTLMLGSACNSWPAIYSVKNPGRRVERLPSSEIPQTNTDPIRQSTETLADASRESANQLPDIELELSTMSTSSLPEGEATETFLADAVSANENKADDLLSSTKDTELLVRTSSTVAANSVALASSQVEAQKAVAKSPPTTRLVIAGVRPSRGKLKVAIYTYAGSFPNPASASQTLELSPTNPTVETLLPSMKQFAVAVYQDINSDGELNRNRFGIPTEPFAFSNNAMGKRGPPAFEQAVVVQPTEAGEGGNKPFVVSIQLP